MCDFGRQPEILLQIAKKLRFGKIIVVGRWTDNNYLSEFNRLVEAAYLSGKLIITGEIEKKYLIDLYKKVSIRFGFN